MSPDSPTPWARRSAGPLVIAHRGASALAFENSAEACMSAIRHGANAVETDVRRSADGALVCLHDPDMQRLAQDPRLVAELNVEEIRALVPQVLTLDEIIDASARLGLLLDVKLTSERDINPVLEAIAADAGARIVIGLRSPDLAEHALRQLPEASILAFAPTGDLDRWALLRPSWFRLWEADASTENIARSQQLGMRVVVMVGEATGDHRLTRRRRGGDIDENGFQDIAARNPDAIMLDDPRIAARPYSRDRNGG